MKMKKLLLIAALCLSLAACGTSGDTGTGESGGQVTDGSFTNSETDVTISLGMTREEVEGLITPKIDATWVEDEWGNGTMFYGETPEESLALVYQDNKVIGIGVGEHVNTAETSHWSVGGVSKGDTVEDIVAAFGENPSANADRQMFSYPLEDGSSVGFFVGENGLYSYAVSPAPTGDAAEGEPAEGEAAE